MHFTEPFTTKLDVVPMKTQSELPTILKHYKAMVETQFFTSSYKITHVLFYNAGEFRSRELDDFLRSSGILTTPSPPRASESNYMSERLFLEHRKR